MKALLMSAAATALLTTAALAQTEPAAADAPAANAPAAEAPAPDAPATQEQAPADAPAANQPPVTDAPLPEGVNTFNIDPDHSQIVFDYNHMRFSNTYGMFGALNGTIVLDKDNPENSTVEVSFPVRSLLIGSKAMYDHLMGPDFFNATDDSQLITFKSTRVVPEEGDDDEATVYGDLALNGITKEIELDVEINRIGVNNMFDALTIGFEGETEFKRSDFGLDVFVPAVEDKLDVEFSLEAILAK